ncbi:E3 ubiquitin-protein ligase RNF8 isoform X1 [Mixophyes fleayi]|uniref:E3 ubiquitin-protein ligase RNF8 isoform X1 n=1 Tax=Mixophyes fleayi TaxID=3061075 RepID=UPI003F4DE3F4
MAERRSGGLCWCLRRLGESRDRLLLQEGEEVTVGRGLGVTYQLVSKECPLMISRIHCTFRQNAEGQWTVTDNNSLNGAWLNKEKMESQKAYVLTPGSLVQLGVPLPNMDMAEFEYELVQENLEQIQKFVVRPQLGKSRPPRTKRKLNCEDSEASGTEGTSNMSKAKAHRSLRDGEEAAKSYRTLVSKQSNVRAPAEQLGLEGFVDSDVMTATQLQCVATLQLSNMQRSIAELRSLNAQLRDKQAALGDELKTQLESGSKDSKCLQESNSRYKKLYAKREQLLQSMNQLKMSLQEEQQKTESVLVIDKGLAEQLEQAFQEHSLLTDQMTLTDLEQIIEAKFQETQERRVEAQKQEVLDHMNDVLDNELQCIICSEHFIEAVTLNCAHSFCSYCIQSWRKRKDECPICRQEIKSQTRSLVLDNCINRMVDKLSPDMKDRRTALILERKDLAVEVTPIPTDSDSSSFLSDISLLSSSDTLDSDTEIDEISSSEDQLDLDSEDDDDDIFFIM